MRAGLDRPITRQGALRRRSWKVASVQNGPNGTPRGNEGFGPPEEKSTDTIVQFSVEANGELKATGQVIKTNSPCTIVFASV